MPTENQPTWDTPAKIDGLPVTNWKRRTGCTFHGTVATCVERWLGLATNNMREASLGWGPTPDGSHGHMGHAQIGAFVIQHGIPPQMANRRGGQPPPERLVEMVRTDVPWRAPPPQTSEPWGYTHMGSGLKRDNNG